MANRHIDALLALIDEVIPVDKEADDDATKLLKRQLDNEVLPPSTSVPSGWNPYYRPSS